jgi:hypothetical protein
MGKTLHLPRRRRRTRWCEDLTAQRAGVRDEHKDCWRDDFRRN